VRAKYRRQRERMMAADPHCCYCGTELVHFNPGPRLRKREPLPDNFVTIEHVNSRNQGSPRPLRGQWKLACKRCNEERGAAEEAALPIEELHRRSGRGTAP